MAERFKRWKKILMPVVPVNLTEVIALTSGNNIEWLQSSACGGNWKSYDK